MMQQQNIFGDRNFKQKLANFSIDNIPDLESKKKIIEGYIRALESGKIENTKEEAIQADFLNKFFGDILGYDYNDPNLWNLEKESKSVTDGTKADGALGFFSMEGKTKHTDVRAIVELKDVLTDLDKSQKRPGDKRTPVEQAFSYASKAGGCCYWVIVSNFIEIRLYRATDQSRYERFMAAELLNPDHLKRFFFLLQRERLISPKGDSPLDVLYRERLEFEQTISKQFYHRYKAMRIELFEHLKQENPNRDPLPLISKTQKLLDRFIFVCFCEDANLLPTYTLKKTKDILTNAFDFEPNKLWRQLKGLFHSIDTGNPPLNISKFDGGLFAKDHELDSLTIKDSILLKLIDFSDFDFASDLNVNILGHIFEQSLSDIEEIKAQIGNGRQLYEDEKAEIRKNGKRKKEGIFYTPEYITRYIVKEAIGGWLDDRKRELEFYNLPELTPGDIDSIKPVRRKNKKDGKMYEVLVYNRVIEQHLAFWAAYKERLRNIKVLDPACGSGAFLNQAFDYLYAEGQEVNEEISRLHLGQREIFELDRHILTNNIFGVDLNTESVEITKLSLWLKTARKDKELTALDKNIKCGNSLIDDVSVAGERAFDWAKEFPGIMGEGGFDVIIGNPPYVSANNMSFADREYFNKKSSFKTLSGKWDLYIPFVERSLTLLKKGGKQGFIVPFGLLNQPFGEKLRKLILDEYKIQSIVDLRDIKVFQDATVPTCIPIVSNTKSGNYPVEILRLSGYNYEKAYETDVEKFKTADSYMFRTENICQLQDIIEKIGIEAQNKTLGDLFYVSTGAEIHGKEKRKTDGTLESGHSKFDVLSDTYIDGYKNYIEGSSIPKSKEGRYCYPEIDGYLNYDPKNMRSPKFPELFDSRKLIIRGSTGAMGILATYDDRKLYTPHKITIVINHSDLPVSHEDYKPQSNCSLKYLLAIINSKLYHYYYSSVFGGFIDVYPNYLKALPIPELNLEEQQPLIEKSDIMLSYKKRLHDIKYSLIKIIRSKWSNLNITVKISEWYRLTFEDFLKELEKQKIKLSLPGQAEWLEYFNRQKQEAMTIMSLIEKTDNEIDKMVYELYELTDEEIKIVDPMG